MRYDLAIFDFDGTLADSSRWFVAAFNALAPRHGLRTLDAARLEDLRGRGNREIMRHLGVSPWKLPMIARSLRSRMAQEASQIDLFAGIEPVLQTLRQADIACAVVSSNSEANVRAILGPQAAAAMAYFECGASVFGKPRLFRRVMKRAGVPPQRTICIGDEQRDVEAARAVGAASGAVMWGYASPDLLARSGATLLFERPADIAARLAAG